MYPQTRSRRNARGEEEKPSLQALLPTAPGGIEPPHTDSKSVALSTELRGPSESLAMGTRRASILVGARAWRNGRRGGFRTRWAKARGGSTPLARTYPDSGARRTAITCTARAVGRSTGLMRKRTRPVASTNASEPVLGRRSTTLRASSRTFASSAVLRPIASRPFEVGRDLTPRIGDRNRARLLGRAVRITRRGDFPPRTPFLP